MAFDVWSFVGGNVTGAAAMYAIGRVVLKAAERVVRDKYEDRRKLTETQRQALDHSLVVVADMWTAMREERLKLNPHARLNFDNALDRLLQLQHRTGDDEIEAEIAKVINGCSEHGLDQLRGKIGKRLQEP